MNYIKILLIVFLISTSLYAKEKNDKKYYIGIKYGNVITEGSDSAFSEPIANIVGGDSSRLELDFGWYIENEKYGQEKDARLYVFGYAWIYDKEKYNEKGLGIGTKFQSKKIFKSLRFGMSVAAGYGWQDNEGKTFQVDTDSNMLTNATGTISYGKYNATFFQTTHVIEMNLGFEFTYTPIENVAISAGYTYLHRYYDFGYIIEGSSVGTKLSGNVQSGHYLVGTIDISF